MVWTSSVAGDGRRCRWSWETIRRAALPNGAEAIALFQQHGESVRLFITDHSMPVVDGLQAIAEIRRRRPELPIILASARGLEVKPEGIVVLNKPFALAELLKTLSDSLKT